MARSPATGVSETAVQNATHTYAVDAEASDAYAITLDPAPTAYADGQRFTFKANTANTGASSLNVNGLGAKTLKKEHDVDTATGDIEAGSIVEVRFDETNFQIVSTSAVAPGTLNNVVEDTSPQSGGTYDTNSFAINESKAGDVASATTTDLGAIAGNFAFITGTTTITGLGTVAAGTERVVKFVGILILTHNGTSLILPTAANITTAADDRAVFRSLGSGNWICTSYTRADGTALTAAAAGGGLIATVAADVQVGNTTTETNLISISIPANTLSTGNAVKAKLYIEKLDFTISNTVTVRLKYGATTIATASATGSFSGDTKGYIDVLLVAAGATNSQRGSFMLSTAIDAASPGAFFRLQDNGTAAEDSTGALNIVISAQWTTANSGSNINLSHAVIEKVD